MFPKIKEEHVAGKATADERNPTPPNLNRNSAATDCDDLQGGAIGTVHIEPGNSLMSELPPSQPMSRWRRCSPCRRMPPPQSAFFLTDIGILHSS
jgi:hypothetical protein